MSCYLSQMASQYLSGHTPVKRSNERPVFLGAEKIVGSSEQWGENCAPFVTNCDLDNKLSGSSLSAWITNSLV